MIAWLLSPLGRWAAAAAALLAAVVSIYAKGRRDAAQKMRTSALEREVETRRESDAAAAEYRGTGGARERLRDGGF